MVLFFILFFALILFSVPILYCLLIPSLVYLLQYGIGLQVVAQKLIAGVNSFPLLAIPLFVLAGQVMNGAGITRRIFSFCDSILGNRTGGLAYANVMASVIFAGMSGSAIADAGGLGAVEVKAMTENGYDEDFSLAITGASSIIGPIIPPSVPAIVFAVSTGLSVGKLFVAGVVPGILMAIALCIFCYFYCKKRHLGMRRKTSLAQIWRAFKEAFFPLLTPVIILLGIFTGIFTPTETSAITVVYCLVIGFATKDISLKDIPQLLINTVKTTVSVSALIASSALFGYVLVRAQFPQELAMAFTGISNNKYVFLILTNVLLIIVGTFMDNSAAIPILGPILMPIAVMYGIDPFHFAIVFILNMMIGLLTPPVGLVLFTLAKSTSVSFERITKSMLPFLGVLILVLMFITFIPQISTFLPGVLL